MTESEAIAAISEEIKQKSLHEGSGHDWWHVYRVWRTASQIADKDRLNSTIVQLAALVHDISDWKDNNLSSEPGAQQAQTLLSKFISDKTIIDAVTDIVSKVSFKGIANEVRDQLSPEGKAVWDADKLDAIGAIGIARCFTAGGHFGSIIHNPDDAADKLEYGKRLSNTSINHFYEKLLLLKDLMFTKTGRKMAQERHVYMEKFLEKFYREWEGLE